MHPSVLIALIIALTVALLGFFIFVAPIMVAAPAIDAGGRAGLFGPAQ
jgi:hypothetical protein